MAILGNGYLYSVIYSKCPKCNLSDLYVDNHPYHLRKLGMMKKECEKCGQKFEPETGFYYGAMYVSYFLSIFFMFIPAGILFLAFDVSLEVLIGVVFGIYILTYPLLFRWSRNIWLNVFVKFDPELKEKIVHSNIS